VVHIQALRSLLARGLIERAPENLSWPWPRWAPCSGSGAAAGSRAWRCWRRWAPCFGFSTYALWQGDYLRVANIVMVMLLAYGARLAWDFIRHFRERGRCCAPCSPAMSVRR
jgi:hypothetical protein